MSLFGPLFGSGGATVVVSPTFPVLANATTANLIRDRCIDVIEALVPRVLAADHFKRYRNEEGADFVKWAEANPTGALRRFQVRDTGKDQPPEVSNTDYEERMITLSIVVAYPQTQRAGRLNALDRDTAMSKDQHDIEHAVGMCGRLNFSPATNASYPDAAWRSGTTTKIIGNAVDFLVIEQSMAFLRRQF